MQSAKISRGQETKMIPETSEQCKKNEMLRLWDE